MIHEEAEHPELNANNNKYVMFSLAFFCSSFWTQKAGAKEPL